MKKIIIAFMLGLLFASVSMAQDCDRHSKNKIQFKVIKPVSVFKSAVTFTTKAGKDILCSAKKVIAAPFKDVEFRTFEYTFPKLKWEGGILRQIPQPPTEEELKDYLVPIIISDGDNGVSDF